VIDVVCAVVFDDRGRVLMVERPPGGAHGGMWEFPGGKVEAGETPEAALARELEEELGIRAEIGERLAEGSDAHIRLTAYRVDRYRGAIELREHARLRWQRRDEHGVEPLLPEADRAVWAALRT
jgi:8-oxo-dGTP diphosphatase